MCNGNYAEFQFNILLLNLKSRRHFELLTNIFTAVLRASGDYNFTACWHAFWTCSLKANILIDLHNFVDGTTILNSKTPSWITERRLILLSFSIGNERMVALILQCQFSRNTLKMALLFKLSVKIPVHRKCPSFSNENKQ